MITSVANNKVKQTVQLNQKAKARREAGVFVVEGWKMLKEAPPERIRDIFISERFYRANAAEVQVLIEENPLLEVLEIVADDVFLKMSATTTPQGILGVIRQREYRLEDMLLQEAPLLVLLEDIQDPGNLGTILRAGEGAGVDGIIMSRDTVDLYNPKTIRATMGSIYRMPHIYTEEMTFVMERLQEKGITVLAAHLEGACAYDTCSYQGGTAFLIGNEGNGLRDTTVEKADKRILIPMQGQVESLNAAVATALLTYEAARQRKV